MGTTRVDENDRKEYIMPHISLTLYKGRDKEALEKLAKTLQESLKDYWGPEALSVSIKGVAPEEFGDYIHKKIEDEELILTSDYVK